MQHVVSLLWLALGLGLLVGGAEVMLRGATALAKRLGVPAFVIGLTVVAFGTSMPELATGIGAVLRGESQLIVGTVVGSNIANIGLVLGLAALIRTAHVRGGVVRREVPMLIVVTVAMVIAMFGQSIGRVEALLLTIAFVAFVAWTIYASKHLDPEDAALLVEAEQEVQELAGVARSVPVCLALALGGLVAMIIGSDRAVVGATALAQAVGVPTFVIGLTMVAVGTSLPEVVTSAMAALKGHSDLAVGNVLGSNIFNILCVAGLSGLIAPLDVPDVAIRRDAWVMLGLTLGLFPLMLTRFRISRAEGAGLLAVYAAYIALVGWQTSP
ncbi:MAG: sodium:calcium antiporter [Phycisphaerales bacterium]|nr:MAG: sodium:calcium antiporter [Phycisphaerales bacterium]